MALIFTEMMFQIIRDYKALRKRIYQRTAATSTVYKKLGINRMALREIDDIQLHEIGREIQKDLETYIAGREKISLVHCGVEEFLQHVRGVLSDYSIENGKIINKKQETAHTVLEIIQLLALPTSKITADVISKINLYVGNVQKYGTKEQINLLKDAFKKNQSRINEFCAKYGKISCFCEDTAAAAKPGKI
jgi:hypothetical protein